MSKTACNGRLTTLDRLYRVLTTTVFIFDAAMGLLAEPVRDEIRMPGPASIQCIRTMLELSGVRREDDQALRSDLVGYLAAIWSFP